MNNHGKNNSGKYSSRMPVITPPSPAANTTFNIECAVSKPVDCVYAYANGNSNRCTWTGWSGNTAIFSCVGIPASSYTAECQEVPGTADNCAATGTSTAYTVT